MAEFDKSMTGILFKNDQKGNEKAPLYKGDITVGGTTYDLAAWVKDGKNGSKFMSLKVSEKYVKPESFEHIPDDADVPF